jgi:hypothetical protein
VEPIDSVNWYKLRQGDVIKFGRISYKVTHLHIPSNDSPQLRSLDDAAMPPEAPAYFKNILRTTMAGYLP